MIKDEKKEEVRQAADIVDVVSDYVKLRRSGSNFTGLCPFHNEKTPSFSVSPNIGIYKCFGCGEGGDVFNFVMKIDGVGFEEAVRTLADRYNVMIPEKEEEEAYDPRQQLKDGIYHALRFAGHFFYSRLAESEEAGIARDYLKKRGFPWKTVRKYGLGYAPDSFDALLGAAEEAGINLQYLHESGLVKSREHGDGFFDTFRGRLMFPIFNPSGKVIAFGGRTLSSDKKKPKYINSPQTPVYNKSEVLYGIQVAKNDIRKAGEVILVEGYTDVISMHQAGIANVVSTSGTSLTPGQIRIMKRYGDTILMIFDSDSAGTKAAVRGVTIALKEGMAVRVLTLPEGEDPDSYVSQFGGEGFKELQRKETLDFLRYLVVLARGEGRWDDPVERKNTISNILDAIAVIPDELSRVNYVQELSNISRIGDRTLLHELDVIRARMQKRSHPGAARPGRLSAGGDTARQGGKAGQGDATSRNHSESGGSLYPDKDTAVQRDTRTTVPDQRGPGEKNESLEGGDSPSPSVSPDIGVSGRSNPGSQSPEMQTQKVHSQDMKSPDSQSSTSLPRQHTRRPEYEKELIRLMLTFGEKIIIFVGSHCNEKHFEDPELRTFYKDIMQRYQNDEQISVDAYSRREHPFPELIGEIVLERHTVSKRGMNRRGVTVRKDANPINNARGALKSLKIRFLDRTREQLLDEYRNADSKEKARIQEWLKKVTLESNRALRESLEVLFPNEHEEKPDTSDDTSSMAEWLKKYQDKKEL